MPSQENIQICESTDNINQIFSYENDSRSELHCSLRLKDDSVKQPPSIQSNKGFPRTDDNSDHDVSDSGKRKSTYELNSETVCVHIYIYFFICIHCIEYIWYVVCVFIYIVVHTKEERETHLTFLC